MSSEKRRELLELKVPWGHISGISWGNPSNPSNRVLLVHGAMDNADSFKRLIKLLPEIYYYVCIDLPGHGLSSHFPQGINLDFHNFVLTIHYILNELNWNNCFFIGHSFGGQLGAMYSILFPGRIQKMVAIDALMCLPFPPEKVIERLKIIQNATIYELNKKNTNFYTKEEIINNIQTKRPFLMKKEAADALFDRSITKINNKYKFNRDVRMRTLVNFYLNDEHNLEFLKNLKIPVLLLIAKDSWFTLAKKQHLVDIWRKKFDKYIITIDIDGNHDVHNNDPEIVAPFIINFFNNNLKSNL